MRRLILGVIGLAMAAVTTGCLGISAQDNRKWGPSTDSQVVTVQGQVYVVNKKTGAVRKVDLSAAETYKEPAPAGDDKGESRSTK